jgi:hypothetical protein
VLPLVVPVEVPLDEVVPVEVPLDELDTGDSGLVTTTTEGIVLPRSSARHSRARLIDDHE